MTTVSKIKRSISAADVVLLIIVSTLFFCKTKLFYSHLSLAQFPLPLAIASTAILALSYALFAIIFPRGSRTFLFSVYFTLSIFMAIDAVYYEYASKLPSIALLGMLWQVNDVSATIENLIELRHVLLIIDIPLWLIYKINKDILITKITRSRLSRFFEKFTSNTVPALHFSIAPAAFGIFTACFLVFFPEFELQYMINELFCYHTYDIAYTINTVNDEYVVDKSKYVSPDYSDSEYYGLAQGRNVIVIQVEALQNFVIGAYYDGQEITPNLNKLIANDSFYFDNYYYQIGGGNTSDAEFTVNNSLFAPERSSGYVKYTENKYYGLPFILEDNGYTGSYVFHGYIAEFWNRETAYPYQGFDDYTSLEDFENTDMFEIGLSDKEFFRQSAEIMASYEEPFHSFLITVSSHYPYGIPLKDREITIKPEDEGTLFGLYLQAINYADRAIGEFISYLDEMGIYDNSMIVIYGDHYALHNTDIAVSSRVKEMIGRDYTIFDVFNVPMIINVPGIGMSKTISTAGGHVDVLPTALCLLGIHNDKAVMFGTNLLEAEEGFVCQKTHLSIGSFISDSIFFKKPHNNIKSNYDAYLKGTMERLDPYLFREMSAEAERRIEDCFALIDNDDIMLVSEQDE